MHRIIRRVALGVLVFLAELGVVALFDAPIPVRTQIVPALVSAAVFLVLLAVAERRGWVPATR